MSLSVSPLLSQVNGSRRDRCGSSGWRCEERGTVLRILCLWKQVCKWSHPRHIHRDIQVRPSHTLTSHPFTLIPPRSHPHRMAGYDQDLCDQPWSVPLALKLLVTVPPILFILLSLFFLHYYPITEKTRERTKTLLQERRWGLGCHC